MKKIQTVVLIGGLLLSQMNTFTLHADNNSPAVGERRFSMSDSLSSYALNEVAVETFQKIKVDTEIIHWCNLNIGYEILIFHLRIRVIHVRRIRNPTVFDNGSSEICL